MDISILEAARRTLSAEGLRFVTPNRHPEIEVVEHGFPNNRRWPQEPVMTPIPAVPPFFEQIIVRQQHEIARLTLQERGLRREIAERDRRIGQLEKRKRHQRQVRDLLVDLHMRIGDIEAQLSLPQISHSTQQRARVEEIFFHDDPPQLTAEQDN